MFCTKCGNFIQDGISFCNKCGKPIEATPMKAVELYQETKRTTESPKSREYIGKSFDFVHFSLNDSQFFWLTLLRQIEFQENGLLYRKRKKETFIPYSNITGIKDRTKICGSVVLYWIIVILCFLIVFLGNVGKFALFYVVYAILCLKGFKERKITITTSDPQFQSFDLIMRPDNTEADEFLQDLRNETGIR